MEELSTEKVFELLGRSDVPGSLRALEKLCARINELVRLNGEEWVRDNRQNLLSEWEYIVRQGLIGN